VTSARKEYLWLTLIGAGLITAIFVVRAHADQIKAFIDQNPFWGLFLYVLLNVLDSVIAPGATLPLIPVAAHAWGRVPAALITTAGWTLGSLIAFLIGRRWGAPIVRKFTSMQRLQRLKRYIPKDLFWSIALLRLFMPMDVMSYVLGLFTNIGLSKYLTATALGLIPSALILAYLGKLPHAYELIAFGVGAAVIVAYVMIAHRRHRQAA
jgi:uncharacterized membrane protein YdjX (TVP38/TMEM64 family)